jgi:hypothetical protein
MKLPWSHPAVAVLFFALGWTVFNWPALSLLVGQGLPGAFVRLTLAWGLFLAGLFCVARAVTAGLGEDAGNEAASGGRSGRDGD